MTRASELLRQGRHAETWQMCCGYLSFDIEQFMAVQKRLLLGQIQSLNHSKIGAKIMKNNIIQTLDDFRQALPLTVYADYCPELSEKREDMLSEKPAQWVHTSGKSGEYSCKWVPLTSHFVNEMSRILYGLGIISSCREFGEVSQVPLHPSMMYTVAPRPYMSGAMASMVNEQTTSRYYPNLEKAENLSFEDRIKMGFDEALSGGMDYFFGLSLVLAAVGDKFQQSSGNMNIRPFLSRPRALMRLAKGSAKARLARRKLLPKDIWNIKGIITSGLDSSVYKEKIKEFWGRYPLDIYASTESGVIATQTWDYGGMTFIPNLNFLEFIPEKEHLKGRLDPQYRPKTILLDEVKPGECYEIVISNFHGGALTRYRIGDMIRITSLKNDALGIAIPQMAFERRADDLIDFVSVRLNEKTIWKSIEDFGIPYEDWVAYKTPGEMTLNILIEPKRDCFLDEHAMEMAIYQNIITPENTAFGISEIHSDGHNMIRMGVKVTSLPQGSFSRYTAIKRAEGADLAHLKPPHLNPPQRLLSVLLTAPETAPLVCQDIGCRSAAGRCQIVL